MTAVDLKYTAEETNGYTQQYLTDHPVDSLPPSSCLRDWKNTHDEQLYATYSEIYNRLSQLIYALCALLLLK